MPSLPASDSPLSLAKDHFRRQLAACAMGQEFLHASGDDEALARIHSDALPEPANKVEHEPAELAQLRPFAIVGTSGRDGFRYQKAAFGTARDSGILMLQLERDVPANCRRDYAGNLRQFENEIGNWIKQAWALCEVGGYLSLVDTALVDLYQSPPELEESMGTFMFALWRIVWQG